MAGAKRYQDLICWQLADELETLVVALTDTGPVSKDFNHANFLRIARSSLMETHNSARTGFKRGYFSAEDTDKMLRLCARSGKAATGLILYLESQIPPTPRRNRRRRT